MTSIPELEGWDYAPSLNAYLLPRYFAPGLYEASNGRLVNVEDITIGDKTTAYATFIDA